MGTKTYHGKPSNEIVNDLVKKFGMVKADFMDEVVFEDRFFLAFNPDSKLPDMLQAPGGRLTRQILDEMLGDKISITTDLKLPNTITSIAPDAFDDMTSLTALTFPRSTKVQTIEANTFKDCQNLKVLKLGNGIQTIEAGAFQNAESLQSIGLPYSLTSIADTALGTTSCLTEYSFILSESRTMMTSVDQIESESQFYDGSVEVQMDWISRHVEGVEVTQDDGTYVVYSTKPGDGVEYEASKEVIDEITASETSPLMSQNNAPSSHERLLRADGKYEFGWHLSYTTTVVEGRVGPKTAFQISHVPPSEDENSPYAKCTEVKCPLPVYGFGSATCKVYAAEKLTEDVPGKNINLIACSEDIKGILEKLNKDENDKADEQAHRDALDDLARRINNFKHHIFGLPCDICGKLQ